MAANGNEAITLNQLKQFDSFGAENITPEAIGAADAEHVHDASDVTTGTILPARGGAGQPSLQSTRAEMGLGNTLSALPIANGGTGAATAAGAFDAIVVPQYPSNEDLLAYLGLS